MGGNTLPAAPTHTRGPHTHEGGGHHMGSHLVRTASCAHSRENALSSSPPRCPSPRVLGVLRECQSRGASKTALSLFRAGSWGSGTGRAPQGHCRCPPVSPLQRPHGQEPCAHPVQAAVKRVQTTVLSLTEWMQGRAGSACPQPSRPHRAQGTGLTHGAARGGCVTRLSHQRQPWDSLPKKLPALLC